MDFYEELRETTRRVLNDRYTDDDSGEWEGYEHGQAVFNATIEAMKEMMVGKPITGRIEDVLTTLELFGPGLLRKEELTIIVFREGEGWK